MQRYQLWLASLPASTAGHAVTRVQGAGPGRSRSCAPACERNTRAHANITLHVSLFSISAPSVQVHLGSTDGVVALPLLVVSAAPAAEGAEARA